MDIEQRMHKLKHGSDTAQWAASEIEQLRAKLAESESEIKRLESAWHVESMNRKDRIIGEQEAENDRMKAKLAAMESQEPAVHISNGIAAYGVNYDGRRDAVFYAKPVPADKPAVAVPDDHMHVSEFIDLCKSFSSRTGSIYIGDVEGALSGYLSAAKTFAPSRSQQSAQYAAFTKEVREARRLWLDAYPTEDGCDHVTPFDHFLYVDRCPSHEREGE